MSNSGTDALLLGDEVYGIAPWLMTPYKEPFNAPQERSYNKCLKRERLIIERCFQAVKVTQLIRRSLRVREVASSSPVSANALVKIECA